MRVAASTACVWSGAGVQPYRERVTLAVCGPLEPPLESTTLLVEPRERSARRGVRLAGARGCRGVRRAAPDGLEGAAPPRLLAPPAPRASRRTATSGPARAICCTWTPRATRASSGRARVTGDRTSSQRREARSGRVRVRPRDHRRPLPPGLRPAHPDERADTVARLTRRALPGTPAGIHAQRLYHTPAYTRSPRFSTARYHATHLTSTMPPPPSLHRPCPRWPTASPTTPAHRPKPCHTGSTTTTQRPHSASPTATPQPVATSKHT